jgi:hypothetical protein
MAQPPGMQDFSWRLGDGLTGSAPGIQGNPHPLQCPDPERLPSGLAAFGGSVQVARSAGPPTEALRQAKKQLAKVGPCHDLRAWHGALEALEPKGLRCQGNG